MEGESAIRVTTPVGAVFLSYASQDAEAAARMCSALRAAGIEVFFDQSELRGGDAWDLKIRREIHDCALFIPVISMNTASRREGYFRLEWDLADQRSHMMARDQAFIVPVCLDATPGSGTDVPESFHRVQWTRLPSGATPPEFVSRIKRLLSPEPTTARLPTGTDSGASPIPRTTGRPAPLRRALFVIVALLVLAALAYLLINKPWISKSAAALATSNPTSSPGAPLATFNPPPRSIAVLPFVNMSGDKDQEYFSEGLTEEILNSLARIDELQVTARTSSFYFKGEHADLSAIAHKLNVASILEGSVRRSGHRIRITAQLNNARTGYHLWSQTYDRDLSDVLAMQTEIANAVADALKVTLLGDVATKVEVGGTRNPTALDAYLRAAKAYQTAQSETDYRAVLANYSEAIRLDPDYALAYAGRSNVLQDYATDVASGPAAAHRSLEMAQSDARRAIALAPELAEGHLALAALFAASLEFVPAGDEYERALALAPGNARVLRNYGLFAVERRHFEAGLAAVRRALALDPLNAVNHLGLGRSLLFSGRAGEALAALTNAKTLASEEPSLDSWRGYAYYYSGDFEHARIACESSTDNFDRPLCLALVYEKLGRHSEAEASVAKLRARPGGNVEAVCAVIYGEWGDHARALDALEAALRRRDPYLQFLKTSFFDPLRSEPRFQAIERQLKFPD
jgi:TolB-like protein/Flp pilus assembly protein TadD